jgi:hypothetical protein
VSGKVHLGHVPWSHYSHEQLWHMVMSADPARLHERAAHLDTLAARMGDAGRDAHNTLETLLSSWSGATADQVAAVVRPVLDWMAATATTGTEIAARLGQFAAAANRAREEIPAPVTGAATPDQAHAAKTTADHVMHRYEQASVQAYHGMPTFTKPPTVPGVHVPPPVAPPRPAQIQPPVPPLPQQPVTSPTTTPSAVTTPADFVGSASGATGFGAPGGMAGGVVGGVAGGAAGGATAALPGAVSGAGMAAATEGQLAAMTAAEAESAGWSGFAPMGAGGRRGDRDGEHHDRYAGRPDLIGELPPAFPPVLGL